MQVPTRRFGRTEVQMPVLTCGGMRFQQDWEDLQANEIKKEIQDNVETIVHSALNHGINHFETARGYGSSEMQLGFVLPQIERDNLLVQTKIGVKDSAEEFLETFEISMKNLQCEYVDFLSIHGINLPEHVEPTMRKGGCLDAVRQLQKEGRVRFCGFSTHAGPELVIPLCETGEFDYVNLHWYFIYDQLHRSMVDAAAKMDMGILIISPNNKGGMLYHPPDKMAQLCQPLTPMQWNDLYCLARSEVNTLSIGPDKPSDFDEHVTAVTQHWQKRAQLAGEIGTRILQSMSRDLGEEWLQGWHKGLPLYTETPGNVNVKEIVRLWTFHKGLDLTEFAKFRYNLLGNAGHWFPGQQATAVEDLDWTCLSGSPFADRIPAILKEAHALFHVDEEAKRLSNT